MLVWSVWGKNWLQEMEKKSEGLTDITRVAKNIIWVVKKPYRARNSMNGRLWKRESYEFHTTQSHWRSVIWCYRWRKCSKTFVKAPKIIHDALFESWKMKICVEGIRKEVDAGKWKIKFLYNYCKNDGHPKRNCKKREVDLASYMKESRSKGVS